MVLEIVFWDVQHGSSTYIKTPNGTHIVQDLGTGRYSENDSEFSPLKHLKENYGVDQLDQVIITHPHKDHIDDIMNFDELSPKVFSIPTIPDEEVIKNVSDEDLPIFEKYFEIKRKYNRQPVDIDHMDPNNNGGVQIKSFCSDSCSTSNINNFSAVIVIEYMGIKVILPGDNEACSWNDLLKYDEFTEAIKDADILLAPHHGRKSGFHSELFDYFKPRLTIISDSKSIETSDTDRYYEKTTGLNVFHRDGTQEKRYCLTTRKDGVIVIKIGYDNQIERVTLNVTID